MLNRKHENDITPYIEPDCQMFSEYTINGDSYDAYIYSSSDYKYSFLHYNSHWYLGKEKL